MEVRYVIKGFFIQPIIFLLLIFNPQLNLNCFVECSDNDSTGTNQTKLRQQKRNAMNTSTPQQQQQPPIQFQFDYGFEYNVDDDQSVPDFYHYPYNPDEKLDKQQQQHINPESNIPEMREVRENTKSKKSMCYMCSYMHSKNPDHILGSKECDDPFEESDWDELLLVPCSGQCYKHFSKGPTTTTAADGSYRMIRGCSKKCNEKVEDPNDLTLCCNSDRCNTASQLTTFTFFRFVLVIFVILLPSF
ncbi:hypothetical protein HELRODRAFT_192581 [Helobdella robusta]|uniref:Uncharacterized protein n=1 Tax=Helobdella robusta TaxID=6412 RepID=T1FU34_HELRO|nr:hypothetical protein HELRODRAFT_192581 [Helobdella robusta]ESO00710.1 hypothetical protein HELRODRAFT_192581 [Helobdella robusta]